MSVASNRIETRARATTAGNLPATSSSYPVARAEVPKTAPLTAKKTATNSINPRIGVPFGATATKVKFHPVKTKTLSEIDSKTIISENVVPFLRYGTKIKRTKSNQSIVTNRLITHKLGELPSYLKHKATKNNILIAKTKREYEVEKLKLCEVQSKIISLLKTYNELQKNCTEQKEEHLGEVKLIAFKCNKDSAFRVLTKFNANEENAESFTKGFYDEIMLIIDGKLMNCIDLNLQNHNEILLDISQILDSVKFGSSGDCTGEKITTVRTKLAKLLSNFQNTKHTIKTQYSHIIDEIHDLINKKNSEIEHFLNGEKFDSKKECLNLKQHFEQASQKGKHDVEKLEKQVGKLKQQLALKALEADLNLKTVEELKKDLMFLENKMELYSNDVELLSHQNHKTETEKNKIIEELQLLLEQAKAEKLTESALPIVTEKYEAMQKEMLEQAVNIKSLQCTIAEMQGKIDENNAVNNVAAASAEEIQNLFSTLGCKQIEVSRQTRIIEKLEGYNEEAKQQRMQQAKKISRLINENEELKVILSMSKSAETDSSPMQTQELIPITSSLNTSFAFAKDNLFNTSEIVLVENETDIEHAKTDDEKSKDESTPNNPNNGEEFNYESDLLPKPNSVINEELLPTARLSQRNMTVKVRKYFH